MKVNGHGGYWVLEFPVVAGPIIHNAEYEVVTSNLLRPSRTPNGGGWTEGLPTVRMVEHASFSVAEDDVSYPQLLGLTEGAEITVYLKRGALNQFDKITRATVENVRVINPQQKARRVEIVCRHGRYERLVPAPALPA